MFILDEKLQQDSFLVGELPLSQLLLMNDSNYPWLILVPRKNNLKEIIDLSFDDQILLLKEINFVAKILQQEFLCDKLNIANLGNVVAQLHIHIIARNKQDPSFPKPVWGNVPALKYQTAELTKILTKINKYLQNNQFGNELEMQKKMQEKAQIQDNQDIATTTQIKKILFRAVHRGCKETDFLLGNFFVANKDNLYNFGLNLCEEFLEEDDMQIYDWIVKGDINQDDIKIGKYKGIIKLIRDFHKI